MGTLLVSTDLSGNASKAVEYALKLNEALRWKIVVFHCSYIPPAKFMHVAEDQTDVVIAKDRDEKIAILKQQVAAIGDYSNNIDYVVESNAGVVENILDVARRTNANLIISGTHGASGVNQFVFGSNTSELISKSSIPVLAIPADYTYRQVDKIVFASDLHDFRRELAMLIPFAEATRAPLTVMFMDYGPGTTGDLVNNAQAVIDASSFKDIKIVTKPATIERPLFTQINEALKIEDPAWIVMFTRQQSFWDKIFHKSKTEKMAFTLKYPLLSCRKA